MNLESAKASKSEHPIKDDILYRFDFHIDPLTFEQILRKENDVFSAYRSSGSISRLLNPSEKAMKAETLCLFPTYDVGDGKFILRNGGCNISETIGVQLAEHMNELLHMGAESREFYNHYGCGWLENQTIFVADNFYLMLATKLLGIEKEFFSQSQFGQTILSIPETHRNHIKPMNPEALRVYHRLAAIEQEELPNLLSAEIPINLAFKAFYEELENSLQAIYNNVITGDPQHLNISTQEVMKILEPSRILEKAKQAAIAAGAEIEEKFHPDPKAIISALSATIPHLEKKLKPLQADLDFEQSQKPSKEQYGQDFEIFMRIWEEDTSKLEKEVEIIKSKIQEVQELREKYSSLSAPSSRPRSPRS